MFLLFTTGQLSTQQPRWCVYINLFLPRVGNTILYLLAVGWNHDFVFWNSWGKKWKWYCPTPLILLLADYQVKDVAGERGGSVVECRTPEREVGDSKPTAAVLCPWARHFTPRKYWLITQEAVAPSRYDWKIVDWDVKPQHKQTKM